MIIGLAASFSDNLSNCFTEAKKSLPEVHVLVIPIVFLALTKVGSCALIRFIISIAQPIIFIQLLALMRTY